MKNNDTILYIISLIVLIGTACSRQDNQIRFLNTGWRLYQQGQDSSQRAMVPGNIFSDLLAEKQIPDPFYGNNEERLQWIGEADWVYETVFTLTDAELNHRHIDLVFEGLDTYASVMLNNQPVLEANNMFRKWEIEMGSILKLGENTLKVTFQSPLKMDSLKAGRNPQKLPDNRAFTRKAPYQYGWDWGPELVTMGIWRPVYLQFWDDILVKDIYIRQDSVFGDAAYMSANIEIEGDQEEDLFVSVRDIDSREYFLKEKKVILSGDANMVSLPFKIDDPAFWWTHGLGDAHLYKMECKVVCGQVQFTDTIQLGIKNLHLVQKDDAYGSGFHFELNGIPVFMKGANYIPQHSFPDQVTKDDYERIIQDVVDANMNMIRIWGGGIYEEDIFYDLCDQNGILVWQDFMFACNMYPGDEAFLANLTQEATEQVKRLRNHVCIALWCGNNEVSEGWFNWGWQQSLNYTPDDSLKVWGDYQQIFENILPQLVEQYHPNVSYWPSSPKTGWGHEEAIYSGDMHYWGVWWGGEPFEIYEEKVGRFMTEYGFQGFPDGRTVQSFCESEKLNMDDPEFLNHQKHPRGMELIQTYMERDFPVPSDLFDYNYVSQLLQAEGVNKALEAHRRGKYYCMGTLYWQLNDCWPVISWSSVDFYGRWKALHYFAQKTFDDITISIAEEDEIIKVYLISDRLQDTDGNLKIQLMDFTGRVLYETLKDERVPINSSLVFAELKKEMLMGSHAAEDILLYVKFTSEDGEIFDRIKYFVPVKDLALPEAKINVEIENSFIKLSSDYLVKNVYLFHPEVENFEKNYFDLLPGKEIYVELDSPIDQENLGILFLNDIVTKN